MLCEKCGEREKYAREGKVFRLCATCALENFFNFLELPDEEIRPTQRAADVCPTCHGFCNISERGTTVIVCPTCAGTGIHR